MKMLQGDNWVDTLDYFRPDDLYRINVRRWIVLDPVNDAYVIPSRKIRKIWNYRSLGPVPLLKKIVSRLGEDRRNAKFISVGIGVVSEAPSIGRYNVGATVYFVAPLHPAGCERVVLPDVCLHLCIDDREGFAHASLQSHKLVLDQLVGWDPESGANFDPSAIWSDLPNIVSDADFSHIEVNRSSFVNQGSSMCREVAVFGYGHHTRTNILPLLKNRNVSIFERDPTLHEKNDDRFSSMTKLPNGSNPNLTVIATYHHTHASIAVDALKAGSTVVVEKPVATNDSQLRELIQAVEEGGQLFVAFHKRYSEFNQFLREDLKIGTGRSFSYHCTVHEIKLPRNHWYHWPNSGSRILSNGCHWIDHFLFLNDFSPVVESRAKRLGDSEIVCELELENGSVFTMTLTDRGSDPIGVRENIDIFCGERTARICDFTHYVSEDNDRILRDTTIDKLAVYLRMYRSFFGHTESGNTAETGQRLWVSASTILKLETSL